ncbi:complement C4-like [Coregonus clupeaformis]|uniref:complement C4-like n=1 Tax=Coregonus clupeaformis TaxID=59861 RepID=UPI001E1C78C7|nr:complement C4-like [Coregonus clupeaformis]
MRNTLLLIMVALTAVSGQRPICLITAPNIVHLGVEETVTVQLQGATKPIQITLYFLYQTDNNKVLSGKKHVTLNEANGYQEVVKMSVIPSLYKEAIKRIGKTKKIVPYIQLAAESKDVFLEKKKTILLSTKKGYVFIQTDKPIYNPGENVNFRVFTLDNYLLPVEENINVKIFNSKGLLVYNQALHTSKLLQRNIVIPDVETAGHWKIVAAFINHPMSNSSVEFEVREYVLPTFEVKIEALKPYYLVTEESFQFSVSARYTYGKGVNGIAYVRFGLIDGEGNRTHLPGLENKTSIQDGVASITMPTEDLRGKAEKQNIQHIEGYNLYIAVTALETASGDLEEAESTSVKIVTSPYIIDMSKTKEFFTPGGKFSILATTTHPDGSPAPDLRMRASVSVTSAGGTQESVKMKGSGNSKGEAVLAFQVPKLATSMDIKMFADGEEKEVVVSDAKMTVSAVQSEGNSYLSVEIEHVTLEPGGSMTVTLRDITPPGTPQPAYIYYMVLSKGRVVQMNRVQRTELTTFSLPYSLDLVPSFRLVAYYFTQGPEKTTIVADSVWADVKDICKGQIEILPFKEHKPAELVNVVVRTDQGDMVALSAVDTAVYILNKNNKLTPQKMFAYMNSYDLACSMGGGRNYQSVLQDAGLAFITNWEDTEDHVRKDYSCNNRRRQKRALNHHQDFSDIINRYKNRVEKRCCHDGARLNSLGLSCKLRHAKTTLKNAPCRNAFLKCCIDATTLRNNIKKTRKTYSLARTDGDMDEEEAIDEVSVHLRSYFPQTWMWDIVDVEPSGLVRHSIAVPDSITTWEVQAVGISKTKGFCIAEPKPLVVFQDFFVSLRLPYSVKRNEQLQVKAVVYNYRTNSMEVTVELAWVKGLCSAGGDRGDIQVVTVPGKSAVPVYFTVVPLVIGNIPIHVDAYTKTARDQIKKDLKVTGEGELISIQHEYNIDGKAAKSIELKIPPPASAVPGLESDAYISVKGGVMGESVENCLNLDGVDRLISLPKGCAEQTMVTMSPAIHAMRYLDTTGQWIDLKAERRDEAQAMIQTGYGRILTFKKTDGSYGAFLSTPSSVWLTAFIAKELSQCSDVISVEDSYIQQSISYLVSKQLASGAFTDPNPLYDRTMQGGVGGFEGEVSLTAFVLIAMQHAVPLYPEGQGSEVRYAMEQAKVYLGSKLDSLERPFAVAITSYALSLTSPGGDAASMAQTKLRALAHCDNEADTCHWEASDALRLSGEKRVNQVPQAQAISVETTAYALLQTVADGDVPYATRIARWLTEQRQYGGGFRSTQDTVVALEALAKYSILDNDVEDLDLNVEMCHQNGRKQGVHLTKHNALTLSAFQVNPGSKITINTEGKGNGTLSVVQTYRTLERMDLFCGFYSLNVSVEGEVKYRKNADDGPELDYNYNYESEGDGNPSDEPMSRVEWFDLRTRRKRHAPQQEERENSLVYTVCVGLNSGNSTGMVIVDISLLSGLKPNMQDLEENVKGTEKYIDHYDIAPNKVFLYLTEITEEPKCVAFRAKQISPMGLVQPAAAVVYDYYNPERSCTVFYSAPQKSNMISKLCRDNVCSCAEGDCPKKKVTYSKQIEKETRRSFACFSPAVNYVYVIKIVNSSDDGVFKHYTTLLTNILQTGKDMLQTGAVRDMIKRKACDEFDMKTDSNYLIMGRDGTISDTTDHSGKPVYVLDNTIWMEEIPEERKCKVTNYRKACNMFKDFMEHYKLNQCSI